MNHDDSIKKLKQDVVNSYFEVSKESPRPAMKAEEYYHIEQSLDNTSTEHSPRYRPRREPKKYYQQNNGALQSMDRRDQ